MEGTEGGVGAFLAGLDLEGPDADVDGEFEGGAVCLPVFESEFAQG